MRKLIAFCALLCGLISLASCEDPIPADGDWVAAEGFPCSDTQNLTSLLGQAPHPDSPFAHQAARDACGRIGKIFAGPAQCTDRRIEVKCETSVDGWVDLPHLCESTEELFGADWKLDAAEARCRQLGKVFSGDVICVDRSMRAECAAF